MTETERRMMWHEACAALRLGGDYPDWPDRLALPVIALLHDPAAPEGMMSRFLRAEADGGRLPVTEERRVAHRRPKYTLVNGLTGEQSSSPASTTTVTYHTASAADIARILEPVDVGRLLAAWLAPYRKLAEGHQEEAAAPRKAKLKRDFVAEAVEHIRAFHAENEKPFDSNCMLGDAGDLLWLMKRLHPGQFEEMELKAFREHYKGVCKWSRGAGQQAGAKSLYLEIFPAAKAQLAAVVALSK